MYSKDAHQALFVQWLGPCIVVAETVVRFYDRAILFFLSAFTFFYFFLVINKILSYSISFYYYTTIFTIYPMCVPSTVVLNSLWQGNNYIFVCHIKSSVLNFTVLFLLLSKYYWWFLLQVLCLIITSFLILFYSMCMKWWPCTVVMEIIGY